MRLGWSKVCKHLFPFSREPRMVECLGESKAAPWTWPVRLLCSGREERQVQPRQRRRESGTSRWGIMHDFPDCIGDVRFPCCQRRVCKCLENRSCEIGIGRRDHAPEPNCFARSFSSVRSQAQRPMRVVQSTPVDTPASR